MILSTLPPEKNSDGEVLDGSLLQPSGDYVRVIEREGYQEPEDYAASVNKIGLVGKEEGTFSLG
ncbi:MAG: hypothetical protein U5J95_12515 [Balneolaceae bacterium]|nr:hypothetical protein [Balneolaceae bacterium]